MDDLLTVEEAASRVGVSVSRIRQVLGEGRIAGAFKRGGAWWLPKGGLETFVETDRDRRYKKTARTEIPGEQLTMD